MECSDHRYVQNINGDCQRLAAARTFFQVAPPPIPLAYRITHITETLVGELIHLDCLPLNHCQKTRLLPKMSCLTAIASCHRIRTQPDDCPQRGSHRTDARTALSIWLKCQSALSSACLASTLMNHRSTRTPAMTLILAKPKMPSTTCWHKHGPRVPSREHRSTRTIASAIEPIDFPLRPHSQSSAFHNATALDHDDRTGELC